MSRTLAGQRRRRSPVLSVAAAAAVGAISAGPAGAQLASGYSGTSDGVVVMGDDETWQSLRVFGACYARVANPQALRLIATEPGTPAERAAVRAAISGRENCWGYVARVQAPYAWLRGAVAEGLWRRRTVIPPALHRAGPVRGADSRNLHDSSRCFAAMHGDQVRAVLATPLGSRREREAVAAIVSGPFRHCVPAGVAPLNLSPIIVRYALAEALLRLPPAGAR